MLRIENLILTDVVPNNDAASNSLYFVVQSELLKIYYVSSSNEILKVSESRVYDNISDIDRRGIYNIVLVNNKGIYYVTDKDIVPIIDISTSDISSGNIGKYKLLSTSISDKLINSIVEYISTYDYGLESVWNDLR